MGPVEQKQGKRSYQYMNKKYLEISLATRGEDLEKKKGLVKETEELMGLAHQLTYHQLELYNQMLVKLARLAFEIDRTQLKKIGKEIMAISHYNPPQYIHHYFYVLSCSVECGEMEMAEHFLELIERLPETQLQRYARLISQDSGATKQHLR